MCAAKPIQADLTAGWLTGFIPQAGPRYMQIADALEQAMRDGRLSTGDRLPPQRHLAAQLKVDLTTVTRAYEEAKRRRLIVSRRTRGTYVASHSLAQAPLFDLSMNIPPPPDGIDLDQLFEQGIAEVLGRADRTLLTTYHLEGGRLDSRAAGAQWVKPMLGKVDPAHVIVTPGSQAALAGLLLALTHPESAILTEPIVYPGLPAVAAQFGRRIVPVDADEHGMLPDGIRRACRTLSAQIIYLNPTLQNPNTVTMPEYRRKEVAALAREYRLCIIEDDPSWLTAEAAPPPIAHFAPDHVHYISTLSKCLTPGLRVAFVIISDPGMRSRFIAALRSFALMTAPLTSALATQWIRDGSALSLLKGVREETRVRHCLARETLAELYEGTEASLHLWLRLPAHWSASRLTRTAAKDGLLVTPAGAFSTTPDTPNALRVSLGGIPDRERLMTGLQRLAQLIKRRPDAFDDAVI